VFGQNQVELLLVEFVQSALQNVAHGLVTCFAEVQRAPAGAVQTMIAVSVLERKYAHDRAIGLLRMFGLAQQLPHESLNLQTDSARLLQEFIRPPVGDCGVGGRHVFATRRITISPTIAFVGGDANPFQEDFHPLFRV
jgi:hypothetical protein